MEAIAGGATTALSNDELQIYKGISGMGVGLPGQRKDLEKGGDVFKSLMTRWEMKEVEHEGNEATKTDPQIEFEFNNPLYAALSSAAIPSVAGAVVNAFDRRARDVLGKKQL